MSQRGKRQPNKTEDGPAPAKRRKCRPTAAEEEEAAALAAAAAAGNAWVPRPLSDLKISSIYNRSATEAPAELFRKDLISAMKLPDSEPLSTDEYWVISDPWKQEWERGVQVPVNPDSLPEPTVTVNKSTSGIRPPHDFKLPKSKYIRITKDEFFNTEEHFLSNAPTRAEKACSYDLDDCDVAWLQIANGERALMGLQPITEDQLERVVEELELRCWEKVQSIVKTEEGLGIEYDENVICDVCRSPDSEEGNEMVFCDYCNICVHQACYGITTIPSGSWMCRTCALGQRPECVLCPNKGGAMKCTRSGQKWAHVSCALWIPEVSIGCVEKMEPITKISSIPQSRWALICVLCRERVGACIQCSVKTCKTAYHVTCAFKHGLEMRAIIEDENADDGVKLRSYCQKHSVTSKKEKSDSASEDDESKQKKRKDMTSEEKNQARAAKLQEIEAEFDKHVTVKDVTQHMDVDTEGIHFIYNYWKLKRKAGFNRPLLPPKSEDVDVLSRQQEQADVEKMRMFVQLRQDLERVRNLCYMVSRREKLSRSFFRTREQTFHKQVAVLSNTNYNLSGKEIEAVIQANHGPSIYDRLYSQPLTEDQTEDFDLIVARIAGIGSPAQSVTADEKSKTDINGLLKSCEKKVALDNPYKRFYFNGASRRRSSLYGSMSSGSETDTATRMQAKLPPKERLPLDSTASSTEEEEKPVAKLPVRKRVSGSRKNSTRASAAVHAKTAKKKLETSSEDDKKQKRNSWKSPRSRTLRQMERELSDKMGSCTDESDELLPIKASKTEPQKINKIYSDSESEVSLKGELSGGERNDDKSASNTPSDSQHIVRTKAAMKEFSAGTHAKVDKSEHKNGTKLKMSKKVKAVKDIELKEEEMLDDDTVEERSHSKSSKKKEYDPTDLIVPQRQAAKKATESIRSSQGRTKEQMLFEQEAPKTSPPAIEELKLKPKAKLKPKEIKGSKDSKSGDIFEFEKDTIEPDAQEVLAYVPQRQAAKKAAAHIKSGMVKPVAEPDSEGGKQKKDVVESLKGKKEPETIKPRRDSESEKKSPLKSDDSREKLGGKYVSSSSTSSSTSSSDDSSSSSSESEDEEEVDKILKSPIKSPKKEKVDKDVTADKKSSERIISTETMKDDKKSKSVPAQEKRVPEKRVDEQPFLDKGTRSTSSSSASSDDDSDENSMVKKKASAGTESKSKNDALSPKAKSHQHSSSGCTAKPSDQNDERVASGSKSAGKKFKKAPDKKLKTSDRRPELEFQPPIAEGSEPFHAKEKLERGRKLESNDGDWGGNFDGRSRDMPVSKDRSDVSRSAVSSRGEHDSPGKRNRSRSSRVEEQASVEGGREGESAEERSPKKVQHKPDGRKKKPNEAEKVSQSHEVCREAASQSRSHRAPEDQPQPVLKERAKSGEHVPSSLKKAEKNIGEKVTTDDSQRHDAKKVGSQSKASGNTNSVSPQSERESHASQLEREIAERKAEKAEKDATFKRSSRLSIDQLFEKRDKRIDRNKEKEASSQNDKPLSERSNQKLITSKELIKNVMEENFKKRTSPKEDFRGKQIQPTDASNKVSFTREDLKRASKDVIGVENSSSTNKNDIKGIEKHFVMNETTKFNSVITSSKENIPDKKDTVIKKIEKHFTSDKTDSYLSRNDHRNSDAVDNKEIIEVLDVYTPNDNRRDSSESASSISTESDEKNKKNARPMPRCKKKALGILSEIDLTQENTKSNEKDDDEVVALNEFDVPKTEDLISPPPEITIVDSKLQSLDEVKEVVPTPPPSNTSQSFGPENIASTTIDQNTSAAVNTSNYALPSQALSVGNEFPVSEPVPEPVSVEPKKVTSRTSSLNDPSYQHRSIFSPQQPSKDTSVAELFDFGNEILAVDETVHGDGFSIARDTEEIMRAPPVTFSFNSDFLFKEDSKEDSARETLNLVEKLRLEYAKKSTNSSSQADGQENNCVPSSVQDDSVIQLDDITDEKPDVPPVVEIIDPSPHETKEEKSVEIMEPKVDVTVSVDEATDNKPLLTVEPNISLSQPHEPMLHHHTDEQVKNDESSYNNPYEYQSCGMQLDGHKASVPGREKLDRSSTDERWVPPSLEFISQQQHMSIMSHHFEHLPPSVDCTPAPSPYTDLRARAKWADSEVLPARRSSSSSVSSSSSSSHREDMELSKRDDLHLPPHTPGADLSYPGLHPGIPYPPCALSDAPPFHPYSEASPFVGPMIFPPPCSQLPPFSSPGPAMFAPFGPSFAASHSLLQPPPKPPEEPPLMPQPCVAAFTSSSHNMALTAAMVSPPPSVQTPGLLNQEQSPGSNITPASFAPVPDQIQHISMTMSPVQNSQGTLELNHSHPSVTPLPPSSFPPTSLAPVSISVPPSSQAPLAQPAPFQMPAIPPPPAPLPPPVSVQSSLPPPPPPPPPAHHPPESPAPKSASTGAAAGKKSPAKPTRSSARVTSQQGKSPAKSPGKSPRQLEAAGGKTPAHGRVRDSGGGRRGMSKVAVNRAMYNQPRGGSRRGRGRGRGQHVQHFQDSDFLAGNTIHSKLVGTVYDFDDDAPSENVENLRAMRERRRSTDVHDRKIYDSTFLPHDSSHSSKFVGSQQSQNSKLRTSYGSEVRTLRSSSPLSDRHSSSVGEGVLKSSPPVNTNSDRIEHFPDVQPLLPGPVDMRTYSSSYEPNTSNNSSAYHNNLFGSSAAERVPDIVEDLEEELHLTLPAKSLASSKTNDTIQKQTEDFSSGSLALDSATNNKVSLSDSRNQLKVKIKGPFLDANYAASAVAPLNQQQPSLPVMSTFDGTAASSFIPAATGAMSSVVTSGTSNLRRMRKKELLRQYCSQDMNMDDPATVSVTGQAMTPAAPPVNRTVITIPKAVASMTTIPTREDYKAVVDANMEKKRRKEKTSLSTSLTVPRKLRHLDVPHAACELMERRRSISSVGNSPSGGVLTDGNFSVAPVRGRGRASRPAAAAGQAPKLKIKFGNSIIGTQDSEMVLEEKRLRVRPPKKRLMSSVPKPSVEELKRESMKYRKKVMADFDEAEKKHKKVISSKKHKQRHSDTHQVQVIEDKFAEKLIIRINRASKGGSASAISSVGSAGENDDGGSPSTRTDAAATAAASSRTSAATPPSEDAPGASDAEKQSHPPTTVASVDGDNQRKESPLLNVRTCKVTPIRLKLARCQEGYVMKEQSDLSAASEAPSAPSFSEQSRNSESSSSTLPVTKGCEVR
ncbi:PHD finger protein rhinoceros-like [Bacillus rossius redtenbacheri]|uniref:PHD finger protein rhinoceros-like n=1 Tax=Bacillus rossius redtenbacheri TaxID=93214 RepID=UPI002FDD7EFC